MNAVDATSREERTDSGVPPSLLTIVLDTNPHAWSILSSTLPLTQAVANMLVFINAHLAINNMNRIAVMASHSGRAQFLYPTPTLPKERPSSVNGNGAQNGEAMDVDMADAPSSTKLSGDPNKYRPFATIENAITANLRDLITTTTSDDLKESTSTVLSGALTMALSYISKQTLTAPSSTAVSSSADTGNTAGQFNISSADGTGQSTTGLLSRILVISVSGGLATQYIPIMNSVFACQRLAIPIDILTLNQYSEAEFLQQAADATGGIYMDLAGSRIAGLLQTLMMAYLPDQSARKWLTLAGESEGVDFRAACFCHGRVVDLGWVCSICLSIFCHVLEDNTCLTCGTYLSLSNYGTKPVVVPKKKVKKKRLGGIGGTGSAVGTPSRAETPVSEGVMTPKQ
ncbi:hypothetical protein AAFC00_001893 [Neodothiora populina]|uniref:General transcription and DNA repair factor IIH subunit TFB4 n=1 Tax=Neodothiora populina TaxID=2781224 RepID=A0ABR3PRK5_9PEZI